MRPNFEIPQNRKHVELTTPYFSPKVRKYFNISEAISRVSTICELLEMRRHNSIF
jgi:hypothetical protein